MHCDDKRTLAVLKENILICFNQLIEEDFHNETLLKRINDLIQDYNEYKLSM